MKKLFIIFYLGLYILSLISCSKKEFKPDEVDLAGNMTALVNGAKWNSDLNCSFIADSQNKKMIISGYETLDQGFTKTITLSVEDLGTGTFNATKARGTYSNSETGESWVSSGSLYVSISKIDSREGYASGTFSFTAKNPNDNSSHLVSSGTFTNVKLIKE